MILNCLVQILIFTYVTSSSDDRVITSLKYSKRYVKPVVVNGELANKGDVPYMVSIKQKSKSKNPMYALWGNYCGGTIIGPQLVLTAAHCFENKDYRLEFNKNNLRVVAGDLLTNDYHDTADSTGKTQWRRINNIRTHPNYHFPVNDIATVYIIAEWYFDANVSPIPYAKSHSDYISWCTASGYGDYTHVLKARTSTRLLIAKIYTLPRRACSDIWEMNMDDYICTRSAYSDVARGDSGGPLTCKGTLEGRREGPKGILVGVVCGKNFDKTTLFTRVSAFRTFIEGSSESNFSSNFLFTFITIRFLLQSFACF